MIRTLGTGTFGRVKLVRHRYTADTYAMKILQKAQIVAFQQQTNVVTEKKIMAAYQNKERSAQISEKQYRQQVNLVSHL